MVPRTEKSEVVETVAIRLGGEFAMLSETENRNRALLRHADLLLVDAQEKLDAERETTASLRLALEVVGAAAAEIASPVRDVEAASTWLAEQAVEGPVAARVLVTELRPLEAAAQELAARAAEERAALEEAEAELEAERARPAALSASLASRSAALDASVTREIVLRKELDDERLRCKRLTNARAEKEKQLAVALNEKNRIAAMHSKKDQLSRDLAASLKTVERKEEQRVAAQQAVQKQRGIARNQAALAIGEAAAEELLPSAAEKAEAVDGRAGALVPAAADAAVDSPRLRKVPSRVPGADRRFDSHNWRNATSAQREAALRSENAVLIGVVAERDAALVQVDAQMRKLRAEHSSMQTRWREACKSKAAASKTGASQATAGKAASSGKQPPPEAETHTPRPRSAPPPKACPPAASPVVSIVSSIVSSLVSPPTATPGVGPRREAGLTMRESPV